MSEPRPQSEEQMCLTCKANWEARFKAHIVKRLTEGETIWTVEQARKAAHDELDNVEIDLDVDPESSADECLEAWEGGV